MNKLTFSTYAKENGGRVSLLFLLFLLAIYEFVTAGFNTFAIICVMPALVVMTLLLFEYRMLAFWSLIVINYLLQAKWLSLPVPTSVPNELLQLVLLAFAIIDTHGSHFERTLNLMYLAVATWCGFCTLELLNDTCDIGIDGYKPANIVMKLSKCRYSPRDFWEYVIKISDDLGKHMGMQELFDIAVSELHLRELGVKI